MSLVYAPFHFANSTDNLTCPPHIHSLAGLSNCSVAQIEAVIADGINLASVQNSLSLWDRSAAKPVRGDKPVTSMHGVLKLCKQYKIAFIAHGPLGGLQSRDTRRDLKRDYPAFAALAARKGISAHALALAVGSSSLPLHFVRILLTISVAPLHIISIYF